MKRVINFVNKISSIPLLILALVLFVSFVSYFLPTHQAQSAKFMGDAGTLDLKFFPVPDTIYQIAEVYGDEGRGKYILSKFTIDLAWPFVFTLFYLVFINLSFSYIHGVRGAGLSTFALTTLMLDYLENILAAVVMTVYPAKFDFLTWVLTFTTCFKWITMGLVNLLFCYGLLAVPIYFIYLKIKKIDKQIS
jgi:hypothetical protein